MKTKLIAGITGLLFVVAALQVSAEELVGHVVINGESLAVVVPAQNFAKDTIVVGQSSYKIVRSGATGYEGRFLVEVNRVVTEDKNVIVSLDSDFLKGVRESTQEYLEGFFDNAQEIKCDKDSNAFIWLTDNISMSSAGNCTKLE